MQHQVVQFFLESWPGLRGRLRSPCSASICFSSSSIRAEICSSFFISGWTFCVRMRQLFDERHRLAAANTRAAGASVRSSSSTCAGVEKLWRNLRLILLHQMFERLQVVRHALEDLVFFEVLGQRHLDGAVERQVAGVDALERVDDLVAARNRTPALCGGSACG